MVTFIVIFMLLLVLVVVDLGARVAGTSLTTIVTNGWTALKAKFKK